MDIILLGNLSVINQGKGPFLKASMRPTRETSGAPHEGLFKKIDALRELRSCDARGYPWVPFEAWGFGLVGPSVNR